jgi:hypothetical protein
LGYAATVRRVPTAPTPSRKRGLAGLWDDLVDLVSPVPGGGSVTDSSGQTTYVDAAGNPTTDPSQAGGQSIFSSAGVEYAAGGLATAAEQGVTDAASSFFGSIPWWGYVIGGAVVLGVGTVAVKAVLPNPPPRRRHRLYPNPKYGRRVR